MPSQIQLSPSRVTKSASFGYSGPDNLSNLFEDFRCMCNDAIRVAISEKPGNRFKLIELAYSRLKEYGLHTHYILSACEVAFSIYSNKRRSASPYVRSVFLKLDSQSYQLDHFLLRIPYGPRHFIFLVLRGAEYHSSLVDNPNLKRGSVTITPRSVSIAFSKAVENNEPAGFVGIDTNEKNITASASNGSFKRYDELGEVVEIKERYREIRTKISSRTHRDKRIARRLLSKFGARERNRTSQRIHLVTKEIVEFAESHEFGIKMERLTNISKRYRRGNGQNPSSRARMNTWVFGETQRQIDYKAKWNGIPVYYVNPRGTSRNCPDCGSCVANVADRKVYCPMCDKAWDRDDLASKNILACVVPQARPSRRSGDGERGDDGSNLLSRWREGKPDGLGKSKGTQNLKTLRRF